MIVGLLEVLVIDCRVGSVIGGVGRVIGGVGRVTGGGSWVIGGGGRVIGGGGMVVGGGGWVIGGGGRVVGGGGWVIGGGGRVVGGWMGITQIFIVSCNLLVVCTLELKPKNNISSRELSKDLEESSSRASYAITPASLMWTF